MAFSDRDFWLFIAGLLGILVEKIALFLALQRGFRTSNASLFLFTRYYPLTLALTLSACLSMVCLYLLFENGSRWRSWYVLGYGAFALCDIMMLFFFPGVVLW
jgi:hypothetical protein